MSNLRKAAFKPDEIGEGCRTGIAALPGDRMMKASDQVFNPTLMACEPEGILANAGRSETTLYELALFAGGGGGLLGSKLLGWKTVCYVENNKYCCEIIKARIKDGLLEDAPIWDDMFTFDGSAWAGAVDIVSAGFPCQPFSTAGHMRAQRDERNLWPETIRVIDQVRPAWCLLENVPGLLAGSHGYFAQILRDLAERGFDARWGCLPAAAVGAPHHRNRLWIVAHAPGADAHPSLDQGSEAAPGWDALHLPEAFGGGVCPGVPGAHAWFASERALARIDHGVASRLDRVRAIGNGQVPAVVRAAWLLLTAPPQEPIIIEETFNA